MAAKYWKQKNKQKTGISIKFKILYFFRSYFINAQKNYFVSYHNYKNHLVS